MQQAKTLATEAKHPETMPVMMTAKFFLSTSSCLYSGTAKATVTGPNRKENWEAPRL